MGSPETNTNSFFAADLQHQLDLYRSSGLGGLCTVRMDDQLTLLYGNDLYFEIQGYEPEELLNKSCSIFIHPADFPLVKEALEEARCQNKKSTKWEMRVFSSAHELKYTLVSGGFSHRNGEEVFDGCVTDITEQKKTEQALRESEQKFRVASENSNLSFWTYYFDTHEIYQTDASRRFHGHGSVVENVPYSLVESGYVREDSVEGFLAMYDRLAAGEEVASGSFWMRRPGNDGWWCEHIGYTAMFDEDGNPRCAYAVGKDVTNEKLAEERYNEEVSYRNAILSDDVISILQSDITSGCVEKIVTPYSEIERLYRGKNYSECLDVLSAHILGDDQRRVFAAYFSVDVLIEDFHRGKSQKSMRVQRGMPDGTYVWVSMVVKLFQKPDSSHVVAFLYSHDINREVLYSQVMDLIAETNYDFFGYVEASTDTYSLLANRQLRIHPTTTGNGYESDLKSFFVSHCAESDLDDLISKTLLATVIQQLEIKTSYAFEYTFEREDGEKRRKQMRFTYIDRQTQTILCVQADVTELINKEMAQQQALHDALAAAKQANRAKSEFLSRMSHEIRTPMNAIIGMSALAAQEVNDPQAISESLSKIGISARFLLSLINDILDMSRIESGKVSVRNEQIPFEDFIQGISALCYTQARDKGIDFDVVISSFIEESYLGDAMKLQQVLINIVGNALKFTPSGGKVQLIVSQEKQTNDSALMRFTVNDTGVGISEEFMPHLFESFAQQHIGSTSLYGGTGLGLAICKNLVDLMGGEIRVNSIEGVGTEFTVDVNLGLSPDSPRRLVEKRKIPFGKLSALVVDDDVLVCHHTEDILGDIGIKADYVVSGADAIERVRTRMLASVYYDLILVDWKMPGMDGIETTRGLRKIAGPDVTIIIMTAYDWASIEADAKRAGVDYLVSKPLFKSSLYSTIEQAYGEKTENVEEAQKREYDFTGKRVLMAEDHLLNIEVARRLLKAKHLEVEVVENGLLAIERFAASPVGYFDAILMDIRMPVMDGLTATKSIRQMRKEDAQSIPIVAMTANAFDEDMEHSKTAGMNAHIAKPIDPELLYRTLDDFIFRSAEDAAESEA